MIQSHQQYPQRTFFIATMIKDMRLIQMARRWRKATATKQQRITLGTGSVADKGHCIVYTTDNRRFMVPLKYLHCDIFRELFRMSEEAFGLPGNGPITFPCDSVFMDYVVSILKRRLCKDLEKALLMYLASTTASRGCLSSFSSFEIITHQSEGKNILRQQSLLHGF